MTLQQIQTAVCNLYEKWENLPQDSIDFITEIMQSDHIENLYETYRINEKTAKESLVAFEQKYPSVVNTDNVNDIIKQLKARL